MKYLVILFIGLICLSCKEQAPGTEVKKDSAATVDSTKGMVDFAGPDVELIKSLISASEQSDWARFRTYFSDSAVAFYNAWPLDTTQKGTPIEKVIEDETAFRKDMEKVVYGEPIIEVVTTAKGEKYAHLWARWTAFDKKRSKSLDIPFFASFQIRDGKILWIWELYDTKKLE